MEIVPLPADQAHQVVVTGEFVSAAGGSGLVHLTPAFGADDFAMGPQHARALVRRGAADGTFAGPTWPELEDRRVTADETNDLIIRRLRNEGRHLKTEPYAHDYPH